jgi:hypothetical protein
MTDHLKHRYTWEIQREWIPGLWTNQAVLGEPQDPRGGEASDLDPDEFARDIAATFKPEGAWQVMVWDSYSGPPVATLRYDELGKD